MLAMVECHVHNPCHFWRILEISLTICCLSIVFGMDLALVLSALAVLVVLLDVSRDLTSKHTIGVLLVRSVTVLTLRYLGICALLLFYNLFGYAVDSLSV